ncbi:DMT family transporter [Paenactinomyces guangxiensis]|uniref:DMT family transporter n=2 Tax=Paenactinomyces guangxiensis TaxID=1490290 RepID=A0A7W1WUN8_9BACL|nr:DMT family transporter [Paenactinomyces guangxiensis]MBH8593498.1 DMT family transporter [Paenactinomyces guangxiensis]
MYVVSKIVLDYIPPWVLLELRFIIGLVVLGIWAWYQKAWHIDKKDLFLLAIIGLVGYTGSIGLQFLGTDLSGASLGSLITSASPALISFFAWWLLRERLNTWKITSLIVATLGVVTVIGLPQQSMGSASFMGSWILFGAAITWALYTVLSRIQTQKYSSLTVTTWANSFGVLFTLPIASWEYVQSDVQLPTDPLLWMGVGYIGIISTALAFYFWNKGFEYMEASTGSLFFFVQPLVGSVLGYFLLNESLTWKFFVGAFLICIGIYFSTLDSRFVQPLSAKSKTNERGS